MRSLPENIILSGTNVIYLNQKPTGKEPVWNRYGGGMERVWNGYGADCLQTRSSYGVTPELTRVKKAPKLIDLSPHHLFLSPFPVAPHFSCSPHLQDRCALATLPVCLVNAWQKHRDTGSQTAAMALIRIWCGADGEIPGGTDRGAYAQCIPVADIGRPKAD